MPSIIREQAKAGAIVITTKKKGVVGTSIEVSRVLLSKVGPSRIPRTPLQLAHLPLINSSWAPGMPDEWKPLNGEFYHDYTDDASWGPRMVGQIYSLVCLDPVMQNRKDSPILLLSQTTLEIGNGVTSNTNVLFFGKSLSRKLQGFLYQQHITGMLPNSSSRRIH
jgi:hypothetical protein